MSHGSREISGTMTKRQPTTDEVFLFNSDKVARCAGRTAPSEKESRRDTVAHAAEMESENSLRPRARLAGFTRQRASSAEKPQNRSGK
ncbi:hypothetical protein HPB47_028218 [Ixodes persulcatus]|uniref:Uncharacterized protein n=1 Tax=Ixodes persulcatus TaxID=34615 RepID=A0AC60PU50_IXOPE|nr:hypothetical protein HPB47_028218 [Ixodes persulcatus]